MDEGIITSYYINAFRNWPKVYENLLEVKPTKLKDAMRITNRKEKIINLIDKNRNKSRNTYIEKSNNTQNNKQVENTTYFIPYNNNYNIKNYNKYHREYNNKNNNHSNNDNVKHFNKEVYKGIKREENH